MTTDTSEKAFQNDIIAHLVSTGYKSRGTHNYNQASCLDPELTLKFIQETQEKEWKKFQRMYKDQAETKLLTRLVKEIGKKGTINILRNGFKDVGCNFKLFYPKPNNNKNPDLFEKFEKNIFSVIDEQEYTENSMNNLPSKKTIKNAFNEDDYKILIVANKFQTGFDQPILHTIYVDKMLNGIMAVQTLSRANRIHPPHKNDTLILDFANKTEVIQKAFEPYYKETYLKERTDPHKLYDLQDKLLDYHVFDEQDVENFVKSYYKKVPQPKLHAILNPSVDEFRKKKKKDQVGFKKTIRRFQSIYSFLSQLMPFSDVGLEKLYIFNKFLSKKLPTINNPLPFNVLQDIDMDSYKIVNKGKKEIRLSGDGELKPLSDGVGEYAQESYEKLSKIINELNDAFGTDFTDDDKVFLGRIKDHLLKNKDLQNKIEHNSKQNVKSIFDKYFSDEMTELLNSNMKFYKRIVDNDKLREKLKSSLFELVYSEYKKAKKTRSKNPQDRGIT